MVDAMMSSSGSHQIVDCTGPTAGRSLQRARGASACSLNNGIGRQADADLSSHINMVMQGEVDKTSNFAFSVIPGTVSPGPGSGSADVYYDPEFYIARDWAEFVKPLAGVWLPAIEMNPGRFG